MGQLSHQLPATHLIDMSKFIDVTTADWVALLRECNRALPPEAEKKIINRLRKKSWRVDAVIMLLGYAKQDYSPEGNLAFAILAQAVRDLVVFDIQSPQAQKSALKYFMNWRFAEHAELVGLDPDYVLDVLVRTRILKRRPMDILRPLIRREVYKA